MNEKFLKIVLFLGIILCFNLSLYSKEIPKKVLILPFSIYSQQDLSFLKKALPEMLTSRLYSPNKIQIIDMEKLEEALKNYSNIDKRIAEELGHKLGADYVIWGSLTVLGETVSIDAQIMDLSNEKKSAQFFQEIKGISEIIPQLTRFARKSKKYIEGKEEDFYQEDLALAYGGQAYIPGRAHPERGYLGYPYYPLRPPKEEPVVEKAKPRFGGIGDPAYEGLTKDVVIDLSSPQPRIGIAKEEKSNATKAINEPPTYMNYYPPQPYYNYSPPPYYYYKAQPQEEGLLTKMKRAIWPFGGEKPKVPTYQQIPASQQVPISQQVSPSQQIPAPKAVNSNPWRWE
ncbi:MAG: hypothetical protein P3W84_000440 [Thermodesulfobacteriaceae bacterium]|nr:hypothetical protein [Thermodesulfobacteriaceae bacterium]